MFNSSVGLLAFPYHSLFSRTSTVCSLKLYREVLKSRSLHISNNRLIKTREDNNSMAIRFWGFLRIFFYKKSAYTYLIEQNTYIFKYIQHIHFLWHLERFKVSYDFTVSQEMALFWGAISILSNSKPSWIFLGVAAYFFSFLNNREIFLTRLFMVTFDGYIYRKNCRSIKATVVIRCSNLVNRGGTDESR